MKIERLINGTLIREGAGVKVQRYVGVDRSNSLEPILLFDYFDSHEELDFIAGFPPHPHRGFETITYLLQGTITHEDNKGRKGVIGPGDVQWMTAGRVLFTQKCLQQKMDVYRAYNYGLIYPLRKKCASHVTKKWLPVCCLLKPLIMEHKSKL